jgi:DNA modification methylase
MAFSNKVIQGNCLDVLKAMPAASVDGIVCDPPYHLKGKDGSKGFMGKSWDGGDIAYNVEMWKQCLRVLKPGGYLLAFSSARTYHRMAVAIEDAGFEIRDMLEWIYSSGFPKSLNLGKAYDQRMGNKREVVGECKVIGSYKQEKQVQQGYRKDNGNNGYAGERNGANLTIGTSAYEGLGSSLKPAHEPICLARRPLSEPTILDNVIKHGTGGLSIDDCRIPTADSWQGHDMPNGADGFIYSSGLNKQSSSSHSLGRYPANVIVTDDALDDGTVTKSKQSFVSNKGSIWNSGNDSIRQAGQNDSGSKSRYFDLYVWAEKYGLLQYPKASKSERNRGCEKLDEQYNSKWNGQGKTGIAKDRETKNRNVHPTVKPLSVMSWLIRLITRPGMVILDPFTGSGTTPVACILNNRQYIGIELTAEYIPIIEARIKQAELDVKTMFNDVQSVEVVKSDIVESKPDQIELF